MKFTTLCLQLRNKSVGEVNNNTGNSQNYNRYSYVLNNPLKYTDLYDNEASMETAVGASLAGFGGSLENVYFSSTAGFNLYLVSAFGNTTLVSSFGNIGNVKYSANGGLTFENQTAGAYAGELSVGSSGGGESADYLLAKLYWHNQFGGGEDFNIDASTMDFSGISQRELKLIGMKVGGSRGVNLFLSGINQYSLAFGKLTMTYQGNNQFSIESNRFDFEYQSNSSFSRNAGTFIGGAVFGQFYTIPVSPFSIMRDATGFGGAYMINFNGTVYIPR